MFSHLLPVLLCQYICFSSEDFFYELKMLSLWYTFSVTVKMMKNIGLTLLYRSL